jgi:phage terminase small subunit
MKLTDKQIRFCEEYILDLNATRAYKTVYNVKKDDTARANASRLLAKANISARIAEFKSERSERTLVDADYVVKGLKEVAERCMQHKPVMKWDYEEKMLVQETALDEKGNEVGIYEFDSSGANRAYELLGKHLGIFEKDNRQTNPNVFLHVNLSAEDIRNLSKVLNNDY